MVQQVRLTVQQGIWIDQECLAGAGLGDRVELSVEPGQIRIRAAQPSQPTASEAAWKVFCSLGHDAQPGRLANPSTEHDKHLYGAGR